MINKEEIAVQDKVSEYYEGTRYKVKYAKMYHDWWIKKMISMVNVRKGSVVLDNGCGTGILFDYLDKYNCRTIGIDISKGMIEKSRKSNKPLICGDSQFLPFKEKSFDIIFGRSLLHHLLDPKNGIEEMRRVVKKNGKIILADTNNSILSRLPRKIAKKGEHFSEDHKNFSFAELLNMVGSGFKITDIYFFGYIAYPLLGFPDLIGIYKYFPLKIFFAKILIRIDEILSKIPYIKRCGWGVMIYAIKSND